MSNILVLALSLASTSWGAEIALQTAVEDTRGQEAVVLVSVTLRCLLQVIRARG